jgi:hypothetical protein
MSQINGFRNFKFKLSKTILAHHKVNFICHSDVSNGVTLVKFKVVNEEFGYTAQFTEGFCKVKAPVQLQSIIFDITLLHIQLKFQNPDICLLFINLSVLTIIFI